MKSTNPFSYRIGRLLAAVLVLLVAAAVPASAQDAPPPDWLDGFEAEIEQVMADWSVPGLAIGVVKDSAVVFSRGFGVRDTEAGTPVTDETLFAIGSASKAFTAATLGILQDDGQLDWETPVQEYLPRFDMHDDFAGEEMTPVDLLTHRSGLPRHDLVWYGADASRAELFARLEYLPPSEPFRTTFQYQNLMYMTAGYLAGQLTGSTWEDVVRQRIFEPLGMSSSTLSVNTMQQAADYARPYAGGKDSLVAIDVRNIDAVGPAGSINSSVTEMLPWVRLFLDGGKHGDTQVIESGTIDQLMTPRIVVENFPLQFAAQEAPYMMYALGWFVQPYRGHRLLQHGGNIDGFAALVGFMPDDDLGFVILTNKNGTPAPYILMYELIDRMLGDDTVDWNARITSQYEQMRARAESGSSVDTTRVTDTQPSHPLDDYVGQYTHPGYGTFEVTMDADSLVGRYGQFSSTLRHARYDVFELHPEIGGGEQTFPVQFEMAMDGSVDEVVIPLEPAVDPIVFTRSASEALKRTEYLSQFTGEYAFRGQTITVRLRGEDMLTLTVPGQPTYTLEPTDENAFDIQNLSGFRVSFQTDDGAVTQMMLHQPNGTFEAERK
jgi:CubicO group peptidase (beta-lactamase class C family)